MNVETKEKVKASDVREAMGRINGLMLELSETVLTISGNPYPLKDWITVSDYAKRYDVSVARVNNWISRGVVPEESWIVVPELNYLKLIKNQPYEPRAYEARAV